MAENHGVEKGENPKRRWPEIAAGRRRKITAGERLQDLAEAVDLKIVRLVDELVLLLDLLFHEQTRIAVSGDIADCEINTFFDDDLIAADIRHMDLVPPAVGSRAFIFAADRIEKDVIGLFGEGQEAQLRIVKEAVDKMELDQRLLTKKLSAVK